MKKESPNICVMMEKELGVKFTRPFSDGREWITKKCFKNTTEAMCMLGEVGAFLSEHGFIKHDMLLLHCDMAVKIDKNTSLGIDIQDKTLFFMVWSVS